MDSIFIFFVSAIPAFIIIPSMLRYDSSIISPIFWFFIVIIFACEFKLITGFIYGGSTGLRQSFDHEVIIGTIAIFIASISFIIGYSLKFKIAKSKYRNNTNLINYLLYYLIIIYIFLAFLFYIIKINVINDLLSGRIVSQKFFNDEHAGRVSLGYLTIIAEFSAVLYLFFLVYKKETKYKIFYYIFPVLTILVYLISGQRQMIVIFFIAILITSMCISGRNYIFKLKYFFYAIALISLVSFSTTLRVSSTDDSQIGVASGFVVTVQHIADRPYFLTNDKVGKVIEATKEQDLYQYGKSFTSIFFLPVPRVIWPEKPPIRIGPFVGQHIYGFTKSSGVPPSIVGELYMNFHWYGVIVGMFLLGMYSRHRYRHMTYWNKFERGSTILYAIFVVCMILALVTDFNGGLIRFMKFFIAFYICNNYWNYRVRRQRSNVSAPNSLGFRRVQA